MQIAIWGDSITYGSCDEAGLGWVGRFRNTFSTGDYVAVYNRGVNGDTTEDVLKRFLTEADSLEPTQIIFAIGINDTKYLDGETKNKVPLEKFQANMRLLIQQAQVYTNNVVIVGLTAVDESVPRYGGTRFVNRDIQIYCDNLKHIAEEKNLQFIDVFNVLQPESDLFDGVHPNASGYEKLFRAITQKLK